MAKIRDEDIDLLRERADIVEVVSGYTQLKKAGGRTFKGLCPFHAERTPSFTVDVGRGLAHCFGCGWGGNVYQFVQQAENLPFPEAVEWLARRVGFELHYEEGAGDAQRSSVKRRLVEANRLAAEFFHRALMESPEAAEARNYLSGRGFGRDVAERWLLGWAPGRNALVRYLLDRKFTQDEIVQANLGRISDRDGTLYDVFRQRITFPTWSVQDDVVAFGARALGDQQPKYLNTSETPVFSKSRVMYGLNRAKSSIARSYALVVEGYTDVIALHEAGVTQAVATNGTALGDTHFELLKKFSSRAVLMFDADEAGKGATEKGFGIHHRIGLEVMVAPLPAGNDPADLVAKEGPEAINDIIEKARPLLEFKLDQTIAERPTDTIEARVDAVRRAVQVLGWLPDAVARHEYVFYVAQRLGVDIDTVQRALAEARPGPVIGAVGGTGRDSERRLPGHVKVEREALRLLLTKPAGAAPWLQQIGESHFTSPARRELFRAAADVANSGRAADASVAESLSQDALVLFSELTVGAPTGDDHAGEGHEVFTRLQVFALERDIKSRRAALQQINPLDDGERHDALFTELVQLEARRRDLLRSIEQGAA